MHGFRIETFGAKLVAVDCTTPRPTGSQIVIRTLACGVCHSDIHIADGAFDLGGGNRVDLTRAVAPPRFLGHEVLGEVVALGPDATGVAIGDRRVVYPWIGCGHCTWCQAGDEQLCNTPQALGVNCDGGYADHVLVPHPRYLFGYDPLPPAQACTLACSGLTAFGALRKAAPLPHGAKLMIIGAGGVGLSAIRLAQPVLGTAPYVAEPDHTKWDITRAAGAAELIDPAEPGAARTLLKATGGMHAVVDFVGSGTSFAFGQSVLAKSGTMITVGLMGGSTQFAPPLLPLKNITIRGSMVGSLAEMAELMALARAGTLPPLPLETRPFSAANAALDDLRAGRVRGRIILAADP